MIQLLNLQLAIKNINNLFMKCENINLNYLIWSS